MREAVVELPFNDAVTIAVWLVGTVPALALKLAAEDPAGTITDAGMLMAVLLLESATEEPPAGAAFDTVTVQAEVPPEATLVGVHCRLETVTDGANTVSAAVAL